MSDRDTGTPDSRPIDTSGTLPSLRGGADDCYTCSACDTDCPVAAVEDDFPGPKFQGPEQWRLKRAQDEPIDSSILDCSNCMRCDSSCPSGVPLSEMHNRARAEYVTSDLSKWGLRYWRNRLLANYRSSAWLASKVPRLANAAMNFGPLRWVVDQTLGITAEREFPEFATETFRDWWAGRGGNVTSRERARESRKRRGEPVDAAKRVAYFHGCYANYNTPTVGKAMVRVFEHLGYEVVVPRQRCSGTPMFANGMLDDARRHAEVNLDSLTSVIESGYSVITSCTSCSLALRQEYPELFDLDGVDTLAEHTWEALEFLRTQTTLAEELTGADVPMDEFGELAYHAPCHARDQGLDGQPVELFSVVDGVQTTDVGDSCSGISGTYGWKTEHYETSMEVGAEMFEHMRGTDAEVGLTECPTCASQMEHGTGYEIRHPLEVVEAALIE